VTNLLGRSDVLFGADVDAGGAQRLGGDAGAVAQRA
jgi:hypothetical protein